MQCLESGIACACTANGYRSYRSVIQAQQPGNNGGWSQCISIMVVSVSKGAEVVSRNPLSGRSTAIDSNLVSAD